MAHLLGAEALHLEYPTKVVFDSVTLGIADGDRIGVVGRNGDGKSSLIRMLAGRQDPDGGRVTRRGGLRVVDVTRDAVRWRYRLPDGVRVDRALLAGTTVVLLGRYRGAVTLAADVALPATEDVTAFVATFTVP